MPVGIISPADWNNYRFQVYKENRNVFLTHILHKSNAPGQVYDIFITLFRHKSEEYSDIEKAEFFLGPYWRNQVFEPDFHGGLIGIRTSAYGPFLCVCRITFDDGHSTLIHRYIDFEMGPFIG